MKKNIFITITIILFISILFITIYLFYKSDNTLNITQKETVNITEYTIYGTHLNIKGNISLSENIENINIVFKNNNEEIEYELKYTKENNQVYFYLSSLINEGINLENSKIGSYFVLLKINNKYYSLDNNTEYEDLKYYSINNDKTTKLYFSKKNNTPYLKIETYKEKTPEDVYDIVIDAGHGGNDTGAISGNNKESEYTLRYAIELKKSLENLGYKVILTREEDKYLSPYGKNGRAIIPQNVKAKYLISLHLNSIATGGNINGVEVYAPYNANLEFASNLAKNIVNIANTSYSNNKNYKVQDGIYIRTLTEQDVNSAIENAKKFGYDIRNISTDTNYLFMIRETGGIMTGAYITNDISPYGNNPYYNSNIGVESYLIELGYIINSNDLNNLNINQQKYIEAISKTIDDEIKKA